MVRFFHLADYHFGLEFESHNASLRQFLRQSMRQAFVDMIDRAIAEKVDAVLIAGDLLDDSSIDPRNEIFLIRQLRRLADQMIDIYLVRGNHDVTHRLPMPFAHILSSELDIIERPRYRIVGQSFDQQFDLRTIEELPVFDDDKPTIGLFHSQIAPQIEADNRSSYLATSVAELEAAGYDYLALGHVHERASYGQNKQIHYPGSFFPTSRSELGPRGYLDVRITDKLTVRFIPSSQLQFARLEAVLESGDNFRVRTYEQLLAMHRPHQITQIRLEGFLIPEELKDLPEILRLVREEADQMIEFLDHTQMAPLSDITQNPFFLELLSDFDDKLFGQIDQTGLHGVSGQEYRLWYAKNKDHVRRLLLESFYRGRQ